MFPASQLDEVAVRNADRSVTPVVARARSAVHHVFGNAHLVDFAGCLIDRLMHKKLLRNLRIEGSVLTLF